MLRKAIEAKQAEVAQLRAKEKECSRKFDESLQAHRRHDHTATPPRIAQQELNRAHYQYMKATRGLIELLRAAEGEPMTDIYLSANDLAALDAGNNNATKALRAAVNAMPESPARVLTALEVLEAVKKELQQAAGQARGGFAWDNLTAPDILDALKDRARKDKGILSEKTDT